MKVIKIVEKYLINVNGLCIFYMIVFFLVSIKKYRKYFIDFFLIFLFLFIFIKWVEVKKKCCFCCLVCYVRRNRLCFFILYVDRLFLKLFRVGFCILVFYFCWDLFKLIDFFMRKWMKYLLDVYLVNLLFIFFFS